MSSNPQQITDSTNNFILNLVNRDEIREGRQFINDLYCKNNGEGMSFTERMQYILEPKSVEFELQRHFLQEEAFTYKYESSSNNINKAIANSKFANNILFRYFKTESVIQVGQKLDSLTDLEKLASPGKAIKCTIEKEKIYLIYMWSVYKPICKKQLSWLNNLFQENNWENDASFITINTDKNREYAQKVIKLLSCERFLENLYIDEEKFPNHPLFNVAKKYGYPVAILVNSNSEIELCGSLFEINLKEKIDSLTKREKKTKVSNELSKESLMKLKDLCKNSIQAKLTEKRFDINAIHLYGANIKITYTYVIKESNDFRSPYKRLEIERHASAELNYYAHNTDKEILDYIFSGFDKIPELKVTRNVIDTFEIPYDRLPVCSMCNTSCLDAYNNYLEELLKIQKMNDEVEQDLINSEVYQNFKNTKFINKNNEEKAPNEADLIKLKSNPKHKSVAQEHIERDISDISNSYNDSDNEDNNSFTSNNYFSYYYCYKCNKNYCLCCGNLITDLQTISKLHNHFLFYVTTQNRIFSKYILKYNVNSEHENDFRYFLQNVKTKKLNEIACHYMVKCDACLEFPIKTVRWKCCNCFSKNLCDKCKTKIETKSEGYEDIFWRFHHAGCDPFQHVFMKIIFDCFVY